MINMLKRSLLFVCVVAMPMIGHAGLSEEALQRRLTELETLNVEGGYDIEGLRREAGYELQSLTLDQRARLEAENLYTKIQFAVIQTYEDSIKSGVSSDEAYSIVAEQVDADIANFESEALRNHIKDFSEQVLQSQTGLDVSKLNFPDELLQEFAQSSQIRLETLTVETPVTASSTKTNKSSRAEKLNPAAGSGLSTASRGVRSYRSMQQLLSAMVSGDESERWVATTNNSETAESGWEAEATVRIQPKFKFMGIVEVSGGPFVTATLTRFVTLDIKAEGPYPLTNSSGYFDLDWRDGQGRIVIKDGAPQRRFVFFTCSATMAIQVDAGAEASFSVLGAGASASGKRYKRFESNYSSRRVLVPDTINGLKVGLAQLTDICHNRFLNVRVPNGRTIRTNMRTSLQNMTKSLVLESSLIQCSKSNHCVNWFNRQPRGRKLMTVPRCAPGGGGAMSCQVRGKAGARCAVIKNGKNLSVPGSLTCDSGLRCVQTREYVGSYFDWLPPLFYAVGECRR